MADKKYGPPGFMTYREAAIMFSLMSSDDAARAIKATCEYYLYQTDPDNLEGPASQVFCIMRADIDRNNQKYAQTVERNRKNIMSRWHPEATSGIPVVYSSDTNIKPQTTNNDKCMANKSPRPRFVPPTIDEIKAYCLERKNTVDAERFFDFYSANGWVQGRGKPIRDWKAAVRTWERTVGQAPPEQPVPKKFDPATGTWR